MVMAREAKDERPRGTMTEKEHRMAERERPELDDTDRGSWANSRRTHGNR